MSPIHGASGALLKETLTRLNFVTLHCVEEQLLPDGNFPTLDTLNPESPEVFDRSIQLGERVGADLLVLLDPDGDRVAVQVRDDGQYRFLNGNKLSALLLDFRLKHMTKEELIRAYAIKSMVTTRLVDRIAEKYQCALHLTPTGFRWATELIALKNGLSSHSNRGILALACEESSGFLAPDIHLEKDGLLGAVWLVKMAFLQAAQENTLIQALNNLYSEYQTFYHEEVKWFDEIQTEREFLEEIEQLVLELGGKFSGILGADLLEVKDYTEKKHPLPDKLLGDGTIAEQIPVRSCEMIALEFYGDQQIIFRPSGTEPKFKIYCLLNLTWDESSSVEQHAEILSEKCNLVYAVVEQYLRDSQLLT